MKLEDIRAKSHVTGIEPGVAVPVLDVEPAGPDAINVALEEVTAESQFTFTALPADFKLAAEATRIKLAHLFDPMTAIHTSNVDPLPHQIGGVYEAMLPTQPLRFVLADDPGAGKTIMAGLFIRERSFAVPSIAASSSRPEVSSSSGRRGLAEKFGLRFDILTHALVESTQTGNPFTEHNLIIARLDQLARREDWHEKLKADGTHWDLVIVDEAHEMAAHWREEAMTTDRSASRGRTSASGCGRMGD